MLNAIPSDQFHCISSFTQVTWLDGHSLVQTVFTCLYMHNPFIIEDPCLKVIIENFNIENISKPTSNNCQKVALK